MTSDDKIRSAFENKNWQEIKVTDSWQIFKIMAVTYLKGEIFL